MPQVGSQSPAACSRRGGHGGADGEALDQEGQHQVMNGGGTGADRDETPQEHAWLPLETTDAGILGRCAKPRG